METRFDLKLPYSRGWFSQRESQIFAVRKKYPPSSQKVGYGMQKGDVRDEKDGRVGKGRRNGVYQEFHISLHRPLGF